MPQQGRNITALLLAAGMGQRAGAGAPKPYRMARGKPILAQALAPFLAHPQIDKVRVVIRNSDRPLYRDAISPHPKLGTPIEGGKTRQESAHAGLEALAQENLCPDSVLIHDAARPFINAALISRLLAALEGIEGVCPALPATDTIRQAGKAGDTQTLPRETLYYVQTPQAFLFAPLLAAHRKAAGKDFTDDASLLEAAGGRIKLVEGTKENRKLTYAGDFPAEQMTTRIGTGFDVHAFAAGKFLMLGGVKIPHEQGLRGHSDADAALHALTDALLGALAAGDIGMHFPSSDKQWHNAPSKTFLIQAHDLLKQAGGEIANADLTLICQKPALAPHREAMREAIAAMLDCDVSRISIKATTTDGLGFTGRGEGIAAQAVIAIRLPT